MTDTARPFWLRGPRPSLKGLLPAITRLYPLIVGTVFSLLYWRTPTPTLRRYVGGKRWRLIVRLSVLIIITGFCFIYGFFYSLITPGLLAFFLVPPAALGLLVVWALPDSRTAPTRSLEWLFYAFFVGMIMWPNYLAIALPGMPWITLSRLTGFPLLATLLICVSMSANFRHELGKTLKALPQTWILLVIFVIIQTMSIALSQAKADSIQKFIVAQMGWTGAFFISVYLFRRPGRIEFWALVQWSMALFLGVVALWEYKLKRSPWAGHIPSFLKIEDPAVQAFMNGTMRAYTNVYRVQATFTTSLALAEYLALTMPFLIHFTSDRYKTWVRGAAGLSIPFVLVIVYLSGSRLGMVGCFMSFTIYAFIAAARTWMRKKDSILGPAVVLIYPVIFTCAIAATFMIGRLKKAIWGTGAAQFSTDARHEQYALGIPMIIKNPIGHGIGQGAVTLGYAPFGFLTIDFYYLVLGLEYGVLGLLVYVAFIGFGAFGAAKELVVRGPLTNDRVFMAPLCIAMLNFLVIKSVFAQQDNHSIIFMMMGMIVAICAQSKTPDEGFAGVRFIHKTLGRPTGPSRGPSATAPSTAQRLSS